MMDMYEKLHLSIKEYDSEMAAECAREIVRQDMDPLKALEMVMDSLREVGEAFGAGDLWLPDLISSANTAQAALPILETAIRDSGQVVQSLGTIVLGTVSGDLHSIGKSMVSVLLSANGFRVIDLGTNVPGQTFVDAVTEHNPDILAMSALLTTTASEQAKVIKALQDAGIRDHVKVIVGGGAITPEFAKKIGADGYGATAPDAVKLAHQLVER